MTDLNSITLSLRAALDGGDMEAIASDVEALERLTQERKNKAEKFSFDWLGGGLWELIVRDEPNCSWSVKRDWIEAVHDLTRWHKPGRRVVFPDFEAELHDHGLPDGRLDLSLIGWGLSLLLFEVSKEGVAEIHAATDPARLDELERAGEEEWREICEGWRK